jgi:hypothetical protein
LQRIDDFGIGVPDASFIVAVVVDDVDDVVDVAIGVGVLDASFIVAVVDDVNDVAIVTIGVGVLSIT